jgi:hypothetical protein
MMRTAAPFQDQVFTGKDGRLTLDPLQCGVRYLLLEPDGNPIKAFAVEPGKKADLGSLVVDPKK